MKSFVGGNIRGRGGYDMVVWNVIKRIFVFFEMFFKWMCIVKYGNLI